MRKTMLLVEDNPDHLELTLTTLEDNGFSSEIVVARDGQEALDYLFCRGIYSTRATDMPPELVLLDLGLPRMSGLEVLQRMRDDPKTSSIPVVMLTAASEQSEAVRAFKGGLNSFVSKPLDYAEFEEKLQQARQYQLSTKPTPQGN